MLRCGKHKGSTFERVLTTDRKYCAWVVEAHRQKEDLPRDLQKFAKHVEQNHGGVLRVGAHKMEFYKDVVDKFPDYALWAAELAEPSDLMRGFSEYAKKRFEPEEYVQQQQPEKKRKVFQEEREQSDDTGKTDKKCCVCLDSAVQCAFVPCGHMVTCLNCADRVENDGCPICRSDIVMALRIFT